ncbi:unnamed protein product [Arctogadus glacialis]
MAGLDGLRVLLLLAGLVAMANCQVNPTVVLTTTTGQTNSTVVLATTTAPFVVVSENATVDPKNSTGPPPPMCNYSGEADKTGFLFTFEDVTEGNYSIKLTELSTGVSNKVTNEVPLNGTNATHLLQYLKPSTDYRVHISPSNEPKVTCGGNLELKTNGINQDEIVELPTDSYQDICYKTEWNINNAVFDVSRKDYTFCIKPKYTDLCTNLTTLIYPTLTLTKWIGLEYLNPDNIKLEVPNKLPAEINWRNQEDLKCEGLGINFTCQGPDRREYKLDKLEPYTKYSCTGVLYNLNKTIAIEKKVTKEVEITCDLELMKVTAAPSKESVKFQWNTSSKNCSNLSQHNDLLYSCKCNDAPKAHSTLPSKERCEVTGLLPFTAYYCEIQPRFNDKPIGRPTKIRSSTSAGVPKAVEIEKTTQVEHNAFQVECTDLKKEDWKGPDTFYHATITGSEEKKTNGKCFFEFRDLSYSTGYTVSIFAFNGVNSGKAGRVQLQTSWALVFEA